MSNSELACRSELERLVAEAADELTERLNRGERPDVEEYAARHPGAGPALREALAAVLLLRLSGAGGGGDSPAPLTGALGDYRILREVGRGGMGVVYEAVQVSLGRRVALKVLPFAATMGPRHLQRFHNEARAAASLHHEHIVPVHGVGCDRGVHYYAMQFIDGRPLSDLIARQALPGSRDLTAPYAAAAPGADTAPRAADATGPAPRDAAFFRRAAGWGAQAADALEHAHALGVVHRDVKPDNLLIDGQGKLWVADFGLARTGADTGLTMSGDVLGTLRYMSPEQALARHNLVDHRTDVYALGATLYELITGRPAVEGRDRAELLCNIALAEPRAPRAHNRAVPVDLETVVLKCLAKEPAERYATAKELADDLRRFLDDLPVQARRPGQLRRALGWARRNPAVARLAAALALALVLGTIASAALGLQAAAEARRADDRADDASREAEEARRLAVEEGKARARAEQETDRADRVTHGLQLALAVQALHRGELGQARELVEAAPPRLQTTWEHRHVLGFLRRREPVQALGDGSSLITCVAYSRDGAWVASGCWGTDHPEVRGPVRLRLWDARTGRERLTLGGHTAAVRAVAFSPDGRSLASAADDRTVKVWDADGGQVRRTLSSGAAEFTCVAISPNSQRIAAGGNRDFGAGVLKVWDARSGQELQSISGHGASVTSVAYSPDGQRLASGSWDETVRVWHAGGGDELHAFKGHTGTVHSVAFNREGRRLVSGSSDGTVKVWEVPEARPRWHPRRRGRRRPLTGRRAP